MEKQKYMEKKRFYYDKKFLGGKSGLDFVPKKE